jgi:hypothetical protein
MERVHHTARSLLRPARFTPGRVRQVAIPPEARALTTLSHVDYNDAFVVEVGHAPERTGEQWARAILENAPSTLQHVLLRLLSAIGLQLGPIRSDGFVVGWEVRRSTPELVLLGARGSRIGPSAELFFKRDQGRVLWATFVQLDNQGARAVWAGLAPVHRQVVRYLLGQAGRRYQ